MILLTWKGSSIDDPHQRGITMNKEPNPHQPMSESQFIDAVIRLGLIAILLVLCFRIFAPFVGLMLWALILAVTLYPIHQMLAKKLGNRQGRSSTTIVLIDRKSVV